ncbi:MAG: hypothetical protein WC661_12625 [Opitutaceae bacterium]|jgi:hypothetical protein
MTKIVIFASAVKNAPQEARYINWIRSDGNCIIVFALTGMVFEAKDIESLSWSEAEKLLPALSQVDENLARGSLSLNIYTNTWSMC